jgi:hypothetical protein
MQEVIFKDRPWKSGVVAPLDAARPKCQVFVSLDGKTGQLIEDDTDQIDWLIVIKYQTVGSYGH